jgi:hypothetical protein
MAENPGKLTEGEQWALEIFDGVKRDCLKGFIMFLRQNRKDWFVQKWVFDQLQRTV